MVIDDVEKIKKWAGRGWGSSCIWRPNIEWDWCQITGKEPAMKQDLYPLSLYHCENIANNKCHLHFGKGGNVKSYGVEKAVHDHPKTAKAKGDSHCCFWNIATYWQAPRIIILPLDSNYVNTCPYSHTFHLITVEKWSSDVTHGDFRSWYSQQHRWQVVMLLHI